MLTQDIEKLKQAFGNQEFSPADMVRVLQLKSHHSTGQKLRTMIDQAIVHKTRRGYQFGAQAEAPVKAAPAPAPAPAPVVAAAMEVAPLLPQPALVRTNDLYLSERMLLIVSTAFQEASPALRIYTTILEIDPATKHPRNKVLNFIKAREPREYEQVRAWLDGMAGAPHAADETALELAAELEAKLNAAKKEIADLTRKLDAIRGAL
jgi:hypothetical protein